MKVLIFLIALVLSTSTLTNPPFVVRFKSLYVTATPCDYKRGCNIKFDYFEVIEAANKSVIDSVNTFILGNILENKRMFGEYELKQLGADTIKTPEDLLTVMARYKSDSTINGWSHEYIKSHYCFFTAQIEYQTTNYVSISCETDAFLVSHYEYWNNDFANFDIYTGKKILLKDLIYSKDIDEFNRIAEQQFKIFHKLPPNANLEDEGLNFRGGKSFYVNNNFLLRPTGFEFYYNIGEITPFMIGPIQFILPYQSIRHLLKKDNIYIN